MSAQNPSINPADKGSLTGLINFAFDKLRQGLDDCLPARVTSYDPATNSATVEILYRVTTSDGQKFQLTPPARVPVQMIGGGGFLLSVPISAGDYGWLKACDQDISLFLQSLNAEHGNTSRSHSFEDSFFIPDVMRGFSATPGEIAMQSMDGSIKIAASDSAITLLIGGASLTLTGAGLSCSVPITAPDVIFGGVAASAHRHGGVTTGSGTSGAPV